MKKTTRIVATMKSAFLTTKTMASCANALMAISENLAVSFLMNEDHTQQDFCLQFLPY